MDNEMARFLLGERGDGDNGAHGNERCGEMVLGELAWRVEEWR